MKTIEEQARKVDTIATRRKISAEADTCHKPLAYILLDEIDSLRAAAAPREELIAELVGALRHARSTVAMVHREFNSDRFTDRYGDGERATARLAIIDAALAKAEARQ